MHTHKYKVGDKVRATSRVPLWYHWKAGDVGQVSGFYFSSIELKFPSGTGYCSEDAGYIEPVSDFKVGDRVFSKLVPGAGEGIVRVIYSDGMVEVDYHKSSFRVCRDRADTIELAPDAKQRDTTQHIVAAVYSGVPAPSNRPYVHKNLESATAEAARLATANPGTEFAVYARVGGRVADVTVREVA